MPHVLEIIALSFVSFSLYAIVFCPSDYAYAPSAWCLVYFCHKLPYGHFC